jgi:hypothetical protein
MPKETPHRQTSPPASRGGYNNYNDNRGGGYDRGGGRGAYSRGRGNTGGGYSSRGQAYSGYGGYRGRGQQNRGGYSQPPPPPVMNIPFGMSPTEFMGNLVGGFPQGGFNQGFFPSQEWQGPGAMGMNYPPPPPPGMMMGYAPNPMIDQSGGPHGLKRQRDG